MSSILTWLKSIIYQPSRYVWIKQFEIFKELNSFELFLMNNILNKRSYKKGEMLYEKEYPLEAIFLIESGRIELLRDEDAASPVVLGDKAIIGLIDMYSDQVRTGYAKAVDNVTAYAISKTDLNQLMDQRCSLGMKLMRAISRYLSSVITDLRRQ